MVTYKLEDISGKQINRYRIYIVPYYPKGLLVQKQMEKYFSDNSFQRLHPQKPAITKPISVSFDIDSPSIPPNLDKISPNHPITSLDNPIPTWRTTIPEVLSYKNNQPKTSESLYRSRKFSLHVRWTTIKHIYQYIP